MSTIDIRKPIDRCHRVLFAKKEGGTERAYCLERHLQVQFHVVSIDGTKVHVKFEDIDNLIKALKFIKMEWSNGEGE